ncbi:hypothetical protein GGTG_10424 [Gaeumannomyces tritici R3-111a-1]|uniref:Uncharacterized protein n=1 Tax=Gaeumannomyces tritici (strain R3-111a-1) TaxID=644352 RepID=J3PA98_GAET3|nr:hypothetical protein GGTG_10424 [Gaeumannomyces tritici R3-111a-1]EJT71164.1 hypothetical protein GGTG_10424 [Gaeumannomyces tritici R3-111a-1]
MYAHLLLQMCIGGLLVESYLCLMYCPFGVRCSGAAAVIPRTKESALAPAVDPAPF